MRTIQTFVIRIFSPEDFGSELQGQISEPGSADEWRTSFTGVQDLFDQILIRLAPGPALVDIGRPGSGSNGAGHSIQES
jgi:hypothetical protein